MRIAGFRPAVALLPDLLYLVEGVCVDDGRVRVVEDRLVLYRILAGCLVPDGIGIGLEVDSTAGIFAPLQNVCYAPGIPFIGICRFWMIGVAAFPQTVCRDGQHLFFLEQVGDLGRAASFHAKREDALDHLCRFLIHDPFLRVVRIFDIAIRQKSGQRFPTLSLGLDDSPNLPAGISGIELVEPHANSGKVVVHTVLIKRIEIVVDCNVANVVLGKGDVNEHTRHRGVSPKARKVFRQHNGHMIRFDFIQHFLKAGTIKIRSAVSVVDEKDGVREFSVSRIVAEDAALITYGVRLAIQGVLV